MKTELYDHQKKALAHMTNREYFALFCEQGTGKTVMLLADVERLYKDGDIDAALIIAPNGVHTNWTRREIPKHLEIEVDAAVYISGNAKAKRAVESLYKRSGRLKVLSINIDAMNTKNGLSAAMRFAREHRVITIIDESTRIKNPQAARTKKVMRLRDLSDFRRIATGRPITRAPQDVYMQCEFLEAGLLWPQTYRGFVARYCKLLPAYHPLVQSIIAKSRVRRGIPQVVERDEETGRPIYQNLEELHHQIQPFSYSVKKKDCLDLPPKLYKILEFDLTPAQRRVYDTMLREKALVMNDGSLRIPFHQGGTRMKLQQITSGYVLTPDGIVYLEDNPRLKLLKSYLEDASHQFIVWARFTDEIRAIGAMLSDLGISARLYYGETGKKEREAIIDDFQAGKVQAFVGTQAAAGIGLTLTAATEAIYYSNDDDLEHRIQSEDRCHRIGTDRSLDHVLFTDLVARDTIDEPIAESLQAKLEIGDIVVR